MNPLLRRLIMAALRKVAPETAMPEVKLLQAPASTAVAKYQAPIGGPVAKPIPPAVRPRTGMVPAPRPTGLSQFQRPVGGPVTKREAAPIKMTTPRGLAPQRSWDVVPNPQQMQIQRSAPSPKPRRKVVVEEEFFYWEGHIDERE